MKTLTSTLVEKAIEEEKFELLMLCPHSELGMGCGMIYYKPTETWTPYILSERLRDRFSSKSCPYHFRGEQLKLKRTLSRKR